MASGRYRCHGFTRGGSRCKRKAAGGRFCSLHPTAGGLVTKTGFAAIEGVDNSRVSQWLSSGTIEEDGEGRIEWQKAQKSIEASRDYDKPLQRNRKSKADHPDEDDVRARQRRAKMLRDEERARLAQIERMKASEDLLSAEAVEAEIADHCQKFRAQILTVPDRVAGKLVGMTDRREITQLIEDELHECLTTLTTGLGADE